MMTIDKFIINDAPVQQVKDRFLQAHGISLYIKREDLISDEISGNKWYKLKYNLLKARELGYDTLLSFGGAYSNHIFAVASAGKIFGYKTIGVIRGEQQLPLNPTLSYAVNCGMNLYYMDRQEYRRKNDFTVIQKLKENIGDFYLIPEGGSNTEGVRGSSEILNNVNLEFNYVCVPCGTGGTLAGIVPALRSNQKALGFAVLKDAAFLKPIVRKLIFDFNFRQYTNWEILLNYHFGGYAKFDEKLWNFIHNFEASHGITLEPIYTGKMFFGIYDMIARQYFRKGSIILAIHTGGLQGLKGIKEKQLGKN